MSIFFDLNEAEKIAVTEFCRQQVRDCEEYITTKVAELNEARAELDKAYSKWCDQEASAGRPKPAYPKCRDIPPLDSIIAPAGMSPECDRTERFIALRERYYVMLRYLLASFPLRPISTTSDPEKLLTFSSGTTQTFAEVEPNLKDVILDLARDSLNCAELSDPEVLLRMERWYRSKGLGYVVPFHECPIGPIALIFSHNWSSVELEKLELGGHSIIRFLGTTVERNWDEFEFSTDVKPGIDWYVRIRLEPSQYSVNQIPCNVLKVVFRLAQLIETSTFSKYPIDSSEFRKSYLHCIPSETIRIVADKAGLSLVEARRLPLVDLVASARRKEMLPLADPAVSSHSVPTPETPKWNKDERGLTFRGKAVRDFAPTIGSDVMTILNTFEECNWAKRIDDPLPNPDAERTKQALRTINKDLKGLKFSKDGDGIKWVAVSP